MNKPSFNAIVCALEVGECASKVRQVDPKKRLQDIPDFMPEFMQQLRNAVAPAVATAKLKVGGEYTVEVGDVRMATGAVYAVAVITRTA